MAEKQVPEASGEVRAAEIGRSDKLTSEAQKKKKKAKKLIRSIFIKILFAAALCFVTMHFFIGVHIHHGNNMYPFIMDGDVVVTYKRADYRTDQAVVYVRPDGTVNVSRIAALKGSTIEIAPNSIILVNGYNSPERVFYPTLIPEDSKISYPLTLTDGYFLMDDYRTQAEDSRSFGAVKEEDIKGIVVYVFRKRGI